ncbi:MAG: hypothetical protein H0X03_03405 [Nitrosopumilus sp.]|nr:hypothetical protein [Nitrosopumilus sp.]
MNLNIKSLKTMLFSITLFSGLVSVAFMQSILGQEMNINIGSLPGSEEDMSNPESQNSTTTQSITEQNFLNGQDGQDGQDGKDGGDLALVQ